MSFLIHLKALLYKELYLLRSDKKRLFLELVMPLIMGFLTFSVSLPETANVIEETDWFEKKYMSTSEPEQSVFKDPFLDYFVGCNWHNARIGIVSPNNEFFKIFNESANNLEMSPMEFENIDAMKKYAKEDIREPEGLCLGIAVEISEGGNKFSYTLFVKDTSTMFMKKGDYSENSLYDSLFNI